MGEVFNGGPVVLARYINVLGSPSVFDFALYFSLKDNLSSDSDNLDALAGVFAKDGAYRDTSKPTTFIDNHDVLRFVSEVQARGRNIAEAAQRLDLALSLVMDFARVATSPTATQPCAGAFNRNSGGPVSARQSTPSGGYSVGASLWWWSWTMARQTLT